MKISDVIAEPSKLPPGQDINITVQKTGVPLEFQHVFALPDDGVGEEPDRSLFNQVPEGPAPYSENDPLFLQKLWGGTVPATATDRLLQKGLREVLFVPLAKGGEDERLVYGHATSEVVDRENEVMDYQGSKPYFLQCSESVRKDSRGLSCGNLREMHQLSAVGLIQQINFNDATKTIGIVGKVIDDGTWKKVKAGVLTGFSIGGKYIRSWKDGAITRYVASPCEVSLVDRPANPDSAFTAIKTPTWTDLQREFVRRVVERFPDRFAAA